MTASASAIEASIGPTRIANGTRRTGTIGIAGRRGHSHLRRAVHDRRPGGAKQRTEDGVEAGAAQTPDRQESGEGAPEKREEAGPTHGIE